MTRLTVIRDMLCWAREQPGLNRTQLTAHIKGRFNYSRGGTAEHGARDAIADGFAQIEE